MSNKMLGKADIRPSSFFLKIIRKGIHEEQTDTETLKEFKCIDNNCQFVERKNQGLPSLKGDLLFCVYVWKLNTAHVGSIL